MKKNEWIRTGPGAAGRRRVPRGAAIIVAALVAGSGIVPAVAQSTTMTSPENAAEDVCPGVQMILFNDVADSAAGLESNTGFLTDVVSPVMRAANEDGSLTTDAGFSAAEKTSSPTTEADDSWKPDVWGTSAAATSEAAQDSWKPDVWASPAENNSATTSQSSVTASTAPNTSTTETSPSTTPSDSSELSGSAEVGRTIIPVRSTDDTRAYIPGVTGPDETPTYEESIAEAIEAGEAVLTEIDASCPETKVVLLGVGQGAQAASTVSKRIGAGEVFPADRVIGVTLFADPTRSENQPTVASGDDAPAGVQEADWNSPAAEGAGIATVTGQDGDSAAADYGAVADRTVSWCMEGDTTCAIPEGAPLRALVANTSAGTQDQAPERALAHVTDILAPAVVLGTVETLAEDVEFGANGFSFTRAQSADETLIGRVAADSDREIPADEMEQRLLASGMSIGGMALAAGVTVANEVVQPHNIAQIAAASAVSPAAGAGAALLIAGGAAMELVSPVTMTTGAARLADEAKAAGIEDEGLAEAAVQAAVGAEVGKGRGSYSEQPATESGLSASDATTNWLLETVGAELGRTLHEDVDGDSDAALAGYDTEIVASISAALQEG